MTFPARLTELLEKATKGPYLLEKGIVGRPTITGAGLIGRSTIAEFCYDAEGWADAESFLLFLNHAEALRDLVVAAEKRKHHYECEDPWYSCPKSENGCADDRQKGCTCGADEMIEVFAKLDEQ